MDKTVMGSPPISETDSRRALPLHAGDRRRIRRPCLPPVEVAQEQATHGPVTAALPGGTDQVPIGDPCIWSAFAVRCFFVASGWAVSLGASVGGLGDSRAARRGVRVARAAVKFVAGSGCSGS